MSGGDPLRGAAQARQIGRSFFRAWYRFRVTGDQLVPRQGQVLIVANHLGFLDGPVLVSAAPRPVRALAKQELFAPPLDRMMSMAGQIPVRYEAPDIRAVRVGLETLARGGALGIFPEAHRGDGRVMSARHGAAYFALRSGAPVVPAAILGTRTDGMGKDALPRPRARIEVVFGEPFTVSTEDDVLRRVVLASAGETVRQRLADHVAEASRQTGIDLPVEGTPRGRGFDVSSTTLPAEPRGTAGAQR